jgi:beta-galactosidase
VQPTNPALAYEETVLQHYESLRRLGLGVDVVSPQADLMSYRVVVAPGLFVMDEATAGSFARYVGAGGTLVLAPRVGVKDRRNAVPELPVPAWLDELAGLEVVDYMSVAADAPVRVAGVEFAGEMHGWYEEVELRDGRATVGYIDGAFPGTPAVVEHAVGSGRCVYLCGAASVPTLEALYRLLCRDADLPLLELPESVEAAPLHANGGDLLFLLNHGDGETSVDLGDETIVLPPRAVALVETSDRLERGHDREHVNPA